MSNIYLPYAQSFVSFLFRNLDRSMLKDIKDVILFGSSARGEATDKSDIDIFVNLFRRNKKIENKIESIKKDFFSSVIVKKYWKLLGIENEINVITGKLDEWKELKGSIISDGIVLYSKYGGILKSVGKNSAIIYWDKIKPESKRVSLSKKLFGYNYKNKRYKGVIEETKAVKLASNCIFVPVSDVFAVTEQFKNEKVPYKIIYVSKI